MSPNVARELAALQRLTVPQLRTRYAEVFGETTNANTESPPAIRAGLLPYT